MTVLTDLLPKAASTRIFRLAAASAAAFLIAAAAVVGALFWQTNDLLTEHVIAGLRTEAAELEADAAGLAPDALAAKIAARARTGGTELYFLGTSSGGRVAGNLSTAPFELSKSPQGGVFRYRPNPAASDEHLAVAIPVAAGPDRVLIVGRDVEAQRDFAAGIKRTFLIGFGLLAAAGVAAGFFAGRSVLRRIEGITGTSREIMAGDLARRIPVSTANDEFDQLSRSLNAMLARIQDLMSGMREVSDNIAHDLKTPLNRLRNRAEEALRDPRGPEAYREGLETTIEKADDLIKTFNALLLIARLEAGVVEESAEPFDLGALVRDVAELYEPVAEEEGLALEIAAEEGIEIIANRQLVGQAVANLADNAIKYSARALARPDLKTIRITAKRAGSDIEIAVADRGPGIAPADRERALRRFVRLEESRTQPGTGLGLSLVAAVARLHHGTIRLEDNAPGLCVVLRLPRKAKKDPAKESGAATRP